MPVHYLCLCFFKLSVNQKLLNRLEPKLRSIQFFLFLSAGNSSSVRREASHRTWHVLPDPSPLLTIETRPHVRPHQEDGLSLVSGLW